MKQVINMSDLNGLPIKLWLDDIEDGALEQAKNLSRLPFAFHHIAIMPDSHQGYGMPIGGVLATKGAIIPNAVGVDIGCGMCAVQTSIDNIDIDTLKKIMGEARESIPVGFKHHSQKIDWTGFDDAPDIPIIQEQIDKAKYQIGTLGGGNHFIEFQEDNNKFLWVMLHSGSRNVGLRVANCYHSIAREHCEQWHSKVIDIDPELSFLPFDSDWGQEYFRAMQFCCDFALANRAIMMRRIKEILVKYFRGIVFSSEINIHHNYAAIEHHFKQNVIVHRKGATKAVKKKYGIIPGSMGTCSYIVQGLGNYESFNSCSHGAGRKMSRKKAWETLDLTEEQAKMKGIVHGLRNALDLDEAPSAYKDIDIVMENQKDLVNIVTRLKPIGVIKASSDKRKKNK